MKIIYAIIAAAFLLGCSNVDQRMECRDVCISHNSTNYRVFVGVAGEANQCECSYTLLEENRK